MAPATQAQRVANRWGSRITPPLLIGIVGYATWVVVVLLAVNNLLQSHSNQPPDKGAGIAIIVIYFLLFFPMSTSYLRVLQTVFTDPGYVRNQQDDRAAGDRALSPTNAIKEKFVEGQSGATPSQQIGYLDRAAVGLGRARPPAGLDDYSSLDIFECEIDGLPRWCSTCRNWKPDRSHHASEVGRCIYKMDHYCPWAGGIISETSFKFFLQFCFYAALYCLFVLIVLAYYTAHLHQKRDIYDVNFIVVIALSALFFLFSLGMFGTSFQNTLINSTTVDNLARGSRTHHFAILIPQQAGVPSRPQETFLNTDSPMSTPGQPRDVRNYPFRTVTYPLSAPDSSQPNSPSVTGLPARTFAILPTPTGSNPYDLGSAFENLKTVMGEHIWDWILPFRRSPCLAHEQWNDSSSKDRARLSMYKLGPVIEQMKNENGLELPMSRARSSRGQDGQRRKRSGHRKKLSEGRTRRKRSRSGSGSGSEARQEPTRPAPVREIRSRPSVEY